MLTNSSATTVRLAPGLEASVDVSHTCDGEDEVHDRIVVRAEGERVEVPVHTSRPRYVGASVHIASLLPLRLRRMMECFLFLLIFSADVFCYWISVFMFYVQKEREIETENICAYRNIVCAASLCAYAGAS